ncbi:WecB/TagA/CpsF family glycosyltransferase [Mesorhizobium sp. CN2-181]|uniref:WecB/TagA/CpsF family glycosyltransferase n=1 Tax=Mesorhizobium yinganensis TaxID=3157707 RepID=UPI0032B7B6EA
MNTHARFAHIVVPDWKSVLGVSVASISRAEAVSLLQRMLEEGHFTRVGFLNAHVANMASTDPEFADALADFLVLPDGIGVDIAAKLLYGEPFPANLNGTDLVPGFLRETQRPLTVGLIGAKAHNVELSVKHFGMIAPQHRFVLINDGYFTKHQEPEILERIRALRPDVLLVAMGVPRQELWIARNITEQHCTMPIAVGALFDFMSGAVPRAPLIIRRLRMEWVFRLWIEPARLWRRYVLGNPVFIARVLREKFRRSKIPA